MDSTYEDYLQSDHWKNLKRESHAIWGDSCLTCRATENIHRHHMFYRANRKESKAAEIIPLCEDCHNAFHKSGILYGKASTLKGVKRQFMTTIETILSNRAVIIDSSKDIFDRIWSIFFRNTPQTDFSIQANVKPKPIFCTNVKKERKRLAKIEKLKKELAKLERCAPDKPVVVQKPKGQLDVKAYMAEMKKDWRKRNWSV